MDFVTVRFVPSWFPGAGFKRYAKSIEKQLSMFENVPFDWAKENIVRTAVWLNVLLFTFSQLSGDYVDSFMSKHLVEEKGLSSDSVKQLDVKWRFTSGVETR